MARWGGKFGKVAALSAAIVMAAGYNAQAAGEANASGNLVSVTVNVSGSFTFGKPAGSKPVCTQPNSKKGITTHTAVDDQILSGVDQIGIDGMNGIGGLLGHSLVKYPDTFKYVDLGGKTVLAGVTEVFCDWTYPTKFVLQAPPAGGVAVETEVTVPIPKGDPWRQEPWYIGAYWYLVTPSPDLLVAPAFKKVEELITDPVLTWPNMNTEGGYVFVRLPMAYTLGSVNAVSAKATAANEVGSAEATVSATPTRVTVTGPDDSSTCLVGNAMTDHGDSEHPPCALTFDSASKGAPITVTLTWTITSDVAGADLPENLTTTSTFDLPVGEVQALVNP